jgi:hypothetical protein
VTTGLIPLLDPSVTGDLVIFQPAWSEVETAITPILGPTGFLAVSRIDQGALMSLRGPALRATQYLVGNPLIATKVITSVAPGLPVCPVSSSCLRGRKWRARLLHASVQSLQLLARSRRNVHRSATGRQDRSHGCRDMRTVLMPATLGPQQQLLPIDGPVVAAWSDPVRVLGAALLRAVPPKKPLSRPMSPLGCQASPTRNS